MREIVARLLLLSVAARALLMIGPVAQAAASVKPVLRLSKALSALVRHRT
nr:hypothetical protein [Kibdelosporangium sp. MJ126-NF4]CTQ90691.1 hypothetical protein [Kibdelosporangium sp. MJ126-NF4]